MLPLFKRTAKLFGIWAVLVTLHAPLLRLPYFWDEAGYYVPAALDFFRHGLLIPASTLPNGHTPLVMAYLGLVWHLFGFNTLATRSSMILIASATVAATGALANDVFRKRAALPEPGDVMEGKVVGAPQSAAIAAWHGNPVTEPAIWSAVLLALAPLFFAQSSMAHLDLAVALFTLVAVIALLDERWLPFALATSVAVLAKETAIVLVPVAWTFTWLEARRSHRSVGARVWIILASPCAILAAWVIYYHHHTGFWTGNAGYLQYNLYSTLNPVRILLCLLRRLHEVFIAGFSWTVTAAAVAAYGWSRRRAVGNGSKFGTDEKRRRRFILLTALLTAAYLAMLSVVGGAILPRYTLPVYPALMVLGVLNIWRLRRSWARACCVLAAAGMIAGWFINPPYPVPFEDNLAYADFVRLHQQAADFLSGGPAAGNGLRILTAWPATNELTTADLGYVAAPLEVTRIDGFAPADFAAVKAGSFDLVYLYSRKWEPPGNWLARFAWIERIEAQYFDYAPQVSEEEIARRYDLRLLARWQRRGQWAAIYQVAGK